MPKFPEGKNMNERKFKIFTDSTSNMVKEDREKYGVDYLHMLFIVDGEEHLADLDWGEISAHDYYELMRKGKRITTSLIKTDECEQKFTEAYEAGYDVLYIACSSKLSASVKTAQLVADELKAKYPDRKAVCIDSLASNYAESLMTMTAAKLADEGCSVEEVGAKIEAEKLKYCDYGTVETLEYLKRAGRIKASKAFFGNLFGVKPIILGDAIGNNYAYKKVKGRKASLDELVNVAVEKAENKENSTLYIDHADSLADAEYVKAEVEKRAKFANIQLGYIGPIVGAAIGPGAVIISFYGEEVTIVGEE